MPKEQYFPPDYKQIIFSYGVQDVLIFFM